MPTKGKTKTRTSKSTKKGPKLKWWYILPVVAIVAVAGYAIVRYSQAAQEFETKYPVNGLVGGTATQNKGNVQVRVVGKDAPVNTKIGTRDVFSKADYRGKWVCAEAWVGSNGNGVPGRWGVFMKSNYIFPSPFGGSSAQTLGSSAKVYSKLNGWDRQCIQIIKNTPLSSPVMEVDVTIVLPPPSLNFVGVSKVWVQNTL